MPDVSFSEAHKLAGAYAQMPGANAALAEVVCIPGSVRLNLSKVFIRISTCEIWSLKVCTVCILRQVLLVVPTLESAEICRSGFSHKHVLCVEWRRIFRVCCAKWVPIAPEMGDMLAKKAAEISGLPRMQGIDIEKKCETFFLWVGWQPFFQGSCYPWYQGLALRAHLWALGTIHWIRTRP